MLTDSIVEFWTLNNTLVGINGNALVSPDGLSHFVLGNIGQAWDVADVIARVLKQTPGPINPGPTSWTLSYWIHISNPETNNYGYHVTVRDGTSLRLYVQLAGWPNMGVRVNTTLYEIYIEGAGPLVAGWNHFVITFDYEGDGPGSHLLRAWVNGTIDDDNFGPVSSAMPTMIAPNLYVGGSGATTGVSAAYEEQIDAVGFWARKLSPEEIAGLYNAGAGWEPTPPDTTPDAFSFDVVADAELATAYATDAETITGMDPATAVSISGDGSPEYRVAGGAWTSAPGTIDPGQTLELRATSPATYETTRTVTVTVGTVSVQWTITTRVKDTTPNAFSFAAISDAELATGYASESAVVTGMDAATAVSISGGGSPEYRVAGGAWTSAPGTIDPGQTLELRATSPATHETTGTVTVTVGTVSVSWTITTRAPQTIRTGTFMLRFVGGVAEAEFVR